jgi:hypothetical protein
MDHVAIALQGEGSMTSRPNAAVWVLAAATLTFTAPAQTMAQPASDKTLDGRREYAAGAAQYKDTTTIILCDTASRHKNRERKLVRFRATE